MPKIDALRFTLAFIMNHRSFAIMAAMTAIAPLAMDGYIPALPEMAVYLQQDLSIVAITVNAFTFGMAMGQLIGGPLSDKYGRYRLITSGISIYILSCIAITLSTNFSLILLLKIHSSVRWWVCNGVCHAINQRAG